MKFFLSSVLVLASYISGIAQTSPYIGKAKITGDVSSISKGERKLNVTYRKIGGGFQFDSCKVSNGVFSFEKELSEPIIAIISFAPERNSVDARQGDGLDFYALFIVPGEGKFKADGSLKNGVFSGTAAVASTDYQEISAMESEYIENHNKTQQNLKLPDGITDTEKQKIRTATSDSIFALRDEHVYRTWINKKPNSAVTAYALLAYAAQPVWTPRKKMQPEDIERLFIKLPISLQNLPSLMKLKDELMVSKATGPGKPFIDFTLRDTSGRQVSLSDFKGKYVFLDFWASWCAPCRKENPNVVKQFNKYKDKNFTVLSVSLDKPEARQAWLNAIHKDQIGMWTHVCDLNGFDGEVANGYCVKSIPTNFLIGPDGKFIARNLYGDALDKELSKIFSK